MPNYVDLSQPYFVGLPQGAVTSPFRLTTRNNVQLPRAELAPPCAVQISEIALPVHCGTHVDAPSHFLPGGPDIDEIPLATVIGQAVIADIACEPLQEITASDIERAGVHPSPGGMVLIRTGWGALFSVEARSRYFDDHPFFAADVADWLIERSVSVFGVDVASPDVPALARQPGFTFPIHTMLLPRGILIIENLNLEPLAKLEVGGSINVFAAPLAIRGSDGAPARVVGWM
jgi:kynurenine formamidase